MTTEEKQKIKSEYKSLGKLSLEALKRTYALSFRVCSLTGASREDLITGIIEARYGARRVTEAFA